MVSLSFVAEDESISAALSKLFSALMDVGLVFISCRKQVAFNNNSVAVLSLSQHSVFSGLAVQNRTPPS